MAGIVRKVEHVLITGATSGIGEAIATKLVAAGKNVYVTGRCQKKLDALCLKLEEIKKKQTINEDQQIRPFRFDIGQLSKVDEAMDQICQCPLDTVIFNAGTMFPSRRPSEVDDRPQLEETIKVNILGHFLMARRLLDNASIRFVCVSSIMAKYATVRRWSSWPSTAEEFPSFFSRNKWFSDGWWSYFDSKLAAIVMSQWLMDEGRSAVAIHPGVSKTAITKAIPFYQYWILEKSVPAKMKPPMETPEVCATRVIDKAVIPENIFQVEDGQVFQGTNWWICDGVKPAPFLTNQQREAFIAFMMSETNEFF